MNDVLGALSLALRAAIARLEPGFAGDVPLQEVPADKPGDYGSPVAFALARTLRRAPQQIAQEIVAGLGLPPGVASAEAVGGYFTFVRAPPPVPSAAAPEP